MSQNTLIHRLVRPAVHAVARTGVTPNHLTTARLATGLGAALALTEPVPIRRNSGALMLLVSLLLDRADGELARLTGASSPAGRRYDLVCDCLATVAVFLGMGWGGIGRFGTWGPLMGVVAGVFVTVVFWELNIVKLVPSGPIDVNRRPPLVDPDDAMLLLPLLIWCGLEDAALVVAAVATPLVAVGFGVLGLVRRRRE